MLGNRHHAVKFGGLALAAALFSARPGLGAEPVTAGEVTGGVPWLFCAGCLVLLMPAGLGLLATGLTRAKNASHTAFLTFFGCAIAVLGVWLGDFVWGNAFAPFFWRAAVACVVVCIPIGALAERWSLKNFEVTAGIMAAVLFPLLALWTWGGGWLARLGFEDAAGAGVVHAAGGLVALAGAAVLGPRIGRYNKDGALVPIPAHNVPLALFGTLLLTAGWLAFNTGRAPANAHAIGAVTILAGASGAVVAATFMTFTTTKPDPTITMNGWLAGLVASSAGFVRPAAGLAVGAVAGLLVCVVIRLLDKRRIDDPVGVIAVHGVGGLCGVLAGGTHFGAQALGAGVLVAVAGGGAWIFFKLIDKILPMRVAPEVELEGLDVSETGVVGYPEFQRTGPYGGGFSAVAPRRPAPRMVNA